LTFQFYPSSIEAISAVNLGEAEGLSYLSRTEVSELKNAKNYHINKLNLPQLTAVFFNNRSGNKLADKKLRTALSYALDSERVVREVLGDDAELAKGQF
jgi:ABC-type oligopeptide transport system substrate-binding subunit